MNEICELMMKLQEKVKDPNDLAKITALYLILHYDNIDALMNSTVFKISYSDVYNELKKFLGKDKRALRWVFSRYVSAYGLFRFAFNLLHPFIFDNELIIPISSTACVINSPRRGVIYIDDYFKKKGKKLILKAYVEKVNKVGKLYLINLIVLYPRKNRKVYFDSFDSAVYSISSSSFCVSQFLCRRFLPIVLDVVYELCSFSGSDKEVSF